jgi:hypothetical protein
MRGSFVLIVAALCPVACVYADHSLCSPDKLTFDPGLDGKWDLILKDGTTDTEIQLKAHPETRTYDAQLRPLDPKEKGKLIKGHVCLADLSGEHYASFQIDEDAATANLAIPGEFTHYRIHKQSPDLVKVEQMQVDSTYADPVPLYAGLQRRPATEPLISGGPPSKEFILTASTSDLQKAVADPERRKMFAFWGTLKRVPAKVPSPARKD